MNAERAEMHEDGRTSRFGEEQENEVEPIEYKFFPDPQQRKWLAEATERAVDFVTEKEPIQESQRERQVIFLDNSARPLTTVFSALWEKKHPGEPVPKTSFLNIGRELLNRETKKFESTPEIEGEILRIQKEYSYLNEAQPGSTIVILDDVIDKGGSRDAALSILSTAFPNVHFEYQAFVKARDHGAATEEGKAAPQLFDRELEDLRGVKKIVTRPPWVAVPDETPEGVTGVIDKEETSLTSQSYKHHPEQSADQQAASRKIVEGLELRFDQASKLAQSAIREAIETMPEFQNFNSEEAVRTAMQALPSELESDKEYKVQIEANFRQKAQKILQDVNTIADELPNISKKLEKPSAENLAEASEYLKKIGRLGSLTHQSVSKDVQYSYRVFGEYVEKFFQEVKARHGYNLSTVGTYETFARTDLHELDRLTFSEDRERYSRHSGRVNVSKMVPQLRHELSQIIEEYWAEKKAE